MLKAFLTTKREAGCDEAGRGCLAGPVVASAVILPRDFKNNLINDSKKLSEKKRLYLSEVIKKNAISYSIGISTVEEIDKYNILNASILAMHRAIQKLTIRPEHLLIDGNRFKKYSNITHKCIIKGDAKFMSIAAASILAKCYRDNLMNKLDLDYPQYNWKKNKGYPTKQHRLMIEKNGITQVHRKSFQLKSNQIKLLV